jgi:hypothetical protein
MDAFTLGERSILWYIKLPNTPEKTKGAIPTAGKIDPVTMAYGNINASPKGNIRIVIALSCRYSSPDRKGGSSRCML